MKNYIAMSSTTHAKYQIYTNFNPTVSFNLEEIGINKEDNNSIYVKINNELDENVAILKYNNNIYELTLNELMKYEIKEEEY